MKEFLASAAGVVSRLLYPAGFFLFAAGILYLLKLNPARAAEDLMDVCGQGAGRKGRTLREKAERLKKGAKPGWRETFYAFLVRAQSSLSVGRKAGGTVCAYVCFLSVALAVVFGFLSFRIGNVFLFPPLAAFGFSLPFLWARSSMEAYREKENAELETALSVLSSSYLRTGDVLEAVRENLPSLRSPVKEAFSLFLFEASHVDADVGKAVSHLKNAFPNPHFREWCDCLAACDKDRAMGDLLLPAVAKMTDERLANGEKKTLVDEAKREYYVMLGLVFGNVPLLYVLNKDWFRTLTDTVPGQIALSVCAAAGLLTFLVLGRVTSPAGSRRERIVKTAEAVREKTVRKEETS